MKSLIGNIADKRGVKDYLIRTKEGSYTDAVIALPGTQDKLLLRLYGLKYGNGILVLYSGGVKDLRTYEEIPKLNKCVTELQRIGKMIDDQIKDGYITNEYYEFLGDLNFEI